MTAPDHAAVSVYGRSWRYRHAEHVGWGILAFDAMLFTAYFAGWLP